MNTERTCDWCHGAGPLAKAPESNEQLCVTCRAAIALPMILSAVGQ